MGPQSSLRLLLIALLALAAAGLTFTPVEDHGAVQARPRRSTVKAGRPRITNVTRTCGAQDGITAEIKVNSERTYYARIVQLYGARSPQARAFVPAARLRDAVADAASLPSPLGAGTGALALPAGAAGARAAGAGDAAAGADGAAAGALLQPSPEVAELTEVALALNGGAGGAGGARRLLQSMPKMVKVNTTFHVVHADTTYLGGYLTQNDVKAQMKVMNKVYQKMKYKFDYDVVYHLDPVLFQVCNQTVRSKYRVGGVSHMNVYTCNLGNGQLQLLGLSSFPFEVTSPSDPDLPQDGMLIDWRTLPAGSYTNYNLGYSLVHEAGHWLGLYHVFADFLPPTYSYPLCELDGYNDDLVTDTPLQYTSTTGCPLSKDSCAGDGATQVDNIHNYMDYSYDVCMTLFTIGQASRSWGLWAAYRALWPS